LEQVDVRFVGGRASRLELVVGLSFALALPALAMAAETSRPLATETTLQAEAHDQNGLTQATLTVGVTGEDGQPVRGAVVIEDLGAPVAGVALNSEGQATSELTLAPGQHSLTASYTGDGTHSASISRSRPMPAATGTTPSFTIAVSPATITLQQGQSGAVTALVTPVNASSLTAPMFVTLSCAGLPDQASCSFTPENLEILPNATAAVTSIMDLATVAQGTSRLARPDRRNGRSLVLAVLVPGALGLVGIAFGGRRRRWLSRLSLLALLGVIGTLGLTGCNPLYYYRNHGPSQNLPTPAGTYTLKVTAQSSNGITATTNSTTMVLTVQ
jgi:Bacterial Ig-like domain (group 3)